MIFTNHDHQNTAYMKPQNNIDTVSRSPSVTGLLLFESIGKGPCGPLTSRTMSHRLPSYLHTLRKQWGLSQPELAALLNLTGSALCRFENRSRRPTAELLVGAEVLFGHVAKEVFPGFYRAVEHAIVERAGAELIQLKSAADSSASQKRRFLTEIVERSSQPTLGL